MKVYITVLVSLVIFSGCASKTQTNRLLNQNTRQALLIQQQQAQIDALRTKLKKRTTTRKVVRKMSPLPPAPKKHIKLKKVEDNNYSSGYMYPGAAKKSPPVKVAQATTTSTVSTMSRAECIGMIGQDKFDKYTQMFGSEAASLKRCKMLKAMKQ